MKLSLIYYSTMCRPTILLRIDDFFSLTQNVMFYFLILNIYFIVAQYFILYNQVCKYIYINEQLLASWQVTRKTQGIAPILL